MVAIKFAMPMEDEESPDYWLPEQVKNSGIKIEHITRWKIWNTRSCIANYILFISNEDANFLLLKYPEMKPDVYVWPPTSDSKIFRDFDK